MSHLRKSPRGQHKRKLAHRTDIYNQKLVRKISHHSISSPSENEEVPIRHNSWYKEQPECAMCEKIILENLAKLKNYWDISRKQRIVKNEQLRAIRNRKHRRRAKAKVEGSKKSNVMKIVMKALEYGVANEVLSQHGKFFCVREYQKEPEVSEDTDVGKQSCVEATLGSSIALVEDNVLAKSSKSSKTSVTIVTISDESSECTIVEKPQEHVVPDKRKATMKVRTTHRKRARKY